MLRKEEWKPINKFEEYYLISSYGRVKSLHFGKQKIMSPRITHDGYHAITMTKKGVKKYKTLHRLVAENFPLNRRLDQDQVNHIDADKANNHIDNLEWCTQIENMKHLRENNLIKGRKGEKHNLNVISEDTVIKVKEMIRDGYRNIEIMEKLNLKYWYVTDIKNEKSWGWLKI